MWNDVDSKVKQGMTGAEQGWRRGRGMWWIESMGKARFTAFSVQLSMESALRQIGHAWLSRSHFWRQASWNLYETHVLREHLFNSW